MKEKKRSASPQSLLRIEWTTTKPSRALLLSIAVASRVFVATLFPISARTPRPTASIRLPEGVLRTLQSSSLSLVNLPDFGRILPKQRNKCSTTCETTAKRYIKMSKKKSSSSFSVRARSTLRALLAAALDTLSSSRLVLCRDRDRVFSFSLVYIARSLSRRCSLLFLSFNVCAEENFFFSLPFT